MLRPSIRVVAYLLVSLMLLLTACAPPPVETPSAVTPSASVTVTDALGRTVSWDAPPQRMVIGGRANFMINDAVYLFQDAPDRVVALTQATQTTTPFLALLEPAFEEKTRFTSESTAEEIATADPDVVFLKRFMQESVGNALETLEIPVVYLDLETPEQYERELQILGTLFGDPDRADAIWAFYESRLARIDEVRADLQAAGSPRVLVVQADPRGGEMALEVPPASWIQTQMVTLTGGDPVWTDAAQGSWAVVNLEQIAAWNPDHIFVISYFEDVDAMVAQLTSNPNWEGLAAVQEGQVHGVPKDYYSWDQPDTRWILGAMWMATRLAPDRTADIDMREEIIAFYDELYGLDAETVEARVFPLLEGDVTP